MKLFLAKLQSSAPATLLDRAGGYNLAYLNRKSGECEIERSEGKIKDVMPIPRNEVH